MKKILLFFLCMLLAASYIYADDESADLSESIPVIEPSDQGNTSVTVDLNSLVDQLTNSSVKYDPDQDPAEVDPLEVTVVPDKLISAETQLMKVSASDATGFKALILQILGDYETVVTDYTYQSGSSGYYSHSINIERDWSWICSCGVFALLLYCTFRSIGGILCRT